jgi:hypothetical protein
MAASLYSSSRLASMITHPVKLAKHNHATWKAQVMATMHDARLEGYLGGKRPKPVAELDAKYGDKVIKVTNPAYEDWPMKIGGLRTNMFLAFSLYLYPRMSWFRSQQSRWLLRHGKPLKQCFHHKLGHGEHVARSLHRAQKQHDSG